MVWLDMLKRMKCSVANPGFPRGGGANSPGVPTNYFAQFSPKLHEIERIWARGRGARPSRPLDPSLMLFGPFSDVINFKIFRGPLRKQLNRIPCFTSIPI